MGSAVVVRRYRVREILRDSILPKPAPYWHHECILQISGPIDSEMLILSQQVLAMGATKMVCNCAACLSYKEEIRSGSFPTTEPLVKPLATVFKVLATFGYGLITSSAIRNGDGSHSTTWVWTKAKQASDI